MKSHAFLSLLFLCTASQAHAQGVPTQDSAGLAQLSAIHSTLGKDMKTQDNKSDTGGRLSAVQSDQLDVLDAMSVALSGPGLDIRALEGHTDFPAGAIYPTADTHPMDSRLFGEARETIEMMMVKVAEEYADAPGVRRAGLTPTQWRCLFQALIKQESRFSVSAVSPVGAYGLTQLMPGTALDMGVDRHDVMDNLRGGARYITMQLETFGNVPLALAAYNAGPARVQDYGGVPPFAETQSYVRNISRYYNSYLETIGGADALGTLSPSDMALAEYSNISDATLNYAADARAKIEQVLNRLTIIIRQIDEMPDIKRAFELNSYAKAEIGRILASRMRLMAASHQQTASRTLHLAADHQAERPFMATGEIR